MAEGAAIQANTLATAASGAIVPTGKEILLLDVTPLSLSIETLGGVATRIVERNTTLPAHYSQVFTTTAPFQASVEVHVVQGERPLAKDNKTIGKFRLKGIKRAMAGVPQIEVTFDIDANGILTVSARDKDTGKEQSITITDDGRLSDAEIARAMEDARAHESQDAEWRDVAALAERAQTAAAEGSRVYGHVRKNLDKDEKRRFKSDIQAVSKLAAKGAGKLTPGEAVDLRSAVEALEGSIATFGGRAG